jgi:hypothetical protein
VRALLVVTSTILALGAVECWTYWFGPGYDEQLLMHDATLGWRLRPGTGGWTAEESTRFVRINSDGLRDREHARAKPPRTIRLAVLGDSYMEATSVAFEDTFAAQLEARLQSCAGPLAVEVINFGVSGYGTAQEHLTFEMKAAAYQPDIVLTAIYFGNDLHNNYQPLNDDDVPFYELRDGELVLDLSHVKPIESQPWRIRARMMLTEHSRTAMLLYRPWIAFRDWQRGDGGDSAKPWDDELDVLQPPPPDSDMAGAWRTTEAVLVKLADSVRARGAEPWFTSVSIALQVDPDLAEREKFRQLLGIDGLFYPEQRVTQFAAERGLPYVPLAQPLAERAVADHVYLHGGLNTRTPAGMGHWNQNGHRLGAEIVARRLCAESETLRRARDVPR